MEQKNELVKEKIEEKIEEVKAEDKRTTEKLTRKEKTHVIVIVCLAVFLALSVYWLYQNTGNVTLEQLIFHLKVPMKGTNYDLLWDYMFWTFTRVILTIFLVGFIILGFEKINKIKVERKKKILNFLSKIILAISIIAILLVMNVHGFVKNQITASKLIENEYVDPKQANIIFTEEKQNLIYIYLESIENTFSSIKNGGMYEEDKMPELTRIALNNINFSNTNKLGGALNLQGTHWTIAAMVAHTSGVPLKISIGDNDYGKHSTFFPGAYTLGEILEENGYTNYLLIGSESEFGGRKEYFESHGNYNIWDYTSAINEARMTEDEKVWWGYSDEDLFKYAKEQLIEISKKEEPFNYTLLTVDTHFTDGYVCRNCDNKHEDQYSNVISCSSKQVSKFVEWIKKQPFYENTTIIITGDHLTMQASIEDEARKNAYNERTVYNTFINSLAETENTINRQFFTLDMFPTTLAAIGAKIEGEKLGLGTNLFSDEQTIAEKYGVEYLKKELAKKSPFYNKKLIYGK